jgi:serine/threonine protein kinase
MDLQSVIDAHGPMTPEHAAALLIAACRGMEHAHEQGAVHRDLRPANLFLVEEPSGLATVKVTGFGLMKQEGEEGSYTVTRGGELLGSPMHMAPEQAKNAKAANTRSDIWSLGATLYHALCGEPPWPPDLRGPDLIIEIGTSKPTHLQNKAPWVSKQLTEVVHRCLKLNPDERWESVTALREALEAITPKRTVKLAELGPLSSSLQKKVAARAEPPEPESQPPPPPQPTALATAATAPVPPEMELPAAPATLQRPRKPVNLGLIVVVTASLVAVAGAIAGFFLL